MKEFDMSQADFSKGQAEIQVSVFSLHKTLLLDTLLYSNTRST